MDADNHPFEPDWTMRPGALLRSALEDRGLTAAAFTDAGIDEATLTGLIKGTVRVDQAIAEAIGRALGTTAQMWLNAQALYDRDIARGAKDLSREYMRD